MKAAACCKVQSATIGWESFKDWLSDELHVSHAVLHIHVGLTVFVLATILLRRPLGSWLPALVVLVLELANETSDFLRYYTSNWPWEPSGTIEDIANTMLWPTLLTLLIRAALRRRGRAADAVSTDG